MKTNFTKTLRSDRSELGEMLWRLARRAAEEQITLKAIEQTVAVMKRRRRKVRGSASVKTIARYVRDTAWTLAEARRTSGRTAAPAPAPLSLEARLARRTARKIVEPVRSLLRNGAAGGGSIRVALVADPEAIGYEVEREKDWEVYRGKFKGWPALVDRHIIRVGRDWLRRVHRPGFIILDGALTLSAVPCAVDVPDTDLFEARRARQGRGYSVVVEPGFIAQDQGLGFAAWGATRGSALQALRRRRETAEALMLKTGLDRDWAARHGRLRATRADARAVSACQEGTEAWLRTAGLAHLHSASLARIHAAWLRDPEDHARLAMRLVVRGAGTETTAAPSSRPTSLPNGERPLRRPIDRS